MLAPAMTSNADLATARSHVYDLFGRLLRGGVTPDLWPDLHLIPDLAPHLAGPFDADEAAAAHHRLFSFEVFPHESVFLDPAGLLGGEMAAAVWRFYQQTGFAAPVAELPDHLGVELALLSSLAGAEAAAWKDEQTAAATRLQTGQRHFLDQHLLRWLPAAIQAIYQQRQPFYTAFAGLLLDFVLDHRAALAADLAAAAPSFHLPAPPDLLAAPASGLDEIAAFLLTPAYSGLYLSRSDLGRLAQTQQLPGAFGDRRHMLATLLRSAAAYDGLDALLAALLLLAGQGQSHLAATVASCPVITPLAAPWQAQLAHTSDLLTHIRTSAVS